MAKTPKPWFRKGRGWFVTIHGKQHNLGRDKKAAHQEFFRLMRQPAELRQVSGRSLAAIVDDFLEYVQNNRASETYRWYRELLQKFIVAHKDFPLTTSSRFMFSDGLTHLITCRRILVATTCVP